MVLPPAAAWIFDYATARAVFDGNNAPLVASVIALCNSGDVRFSFYERKYFLGNALLKPHFCANNDCCCPICGDVAGIAEGLPERIAGKRLHPSDNTQLIIAATAIQFGFGVVSVKSGSFLSSLDIALHAGLPGFTLMQFAALI